MSAEAKSPRSAAYELFMLGLSLYVLAALAAEIILPLNPEIRLILQYADTAICFIFLGDFARNLVRAPRPLRLPQVGLDRPDLQHPEPRDPALGSARG